MKPGVVIFSRPGAEDVELVRVEGGTHVYHMTPLEALNLSHGLFQCAYEIMNRRGRDDRMAAN